MVKTVDILPRDKDLTIYRPSSVYTCHQTVKNCRRTSRIQGVPICNNTPVELAVYVQHVHITNWYQIFITIILVIPFTIYHRWQIFATQQTWICVIIPIVIFIVFVYSKCVHNRYIVNIIIYSLSESFLLAIIAGISKSPIILLTLMITWITISMFVLHDLLIISRLRTTNQNMPGWSPIILLCISWTICLTPIVMIQIVRDTQKYGGLAFVLQLGDSIDVDHIDVLTASIVSLVYLIYVLVWTLWSTEWFSKSEYMIGSIYLFTAILSLIDILIWLFTSYISTLLTLSYN